MFCLFSDHPFFVGVQYHPEFLSRPIKPSPPYFGLLLASAGRLTHYLQKGCRLSPRWVSDRPHQSCHRTVLLPAGQPRASSWHRILGITWCCTPFFPLFFWKLPSGVLGLIVGHRAVLQRGPGFRRDLQPCAVSQALGKLSLGLLFCLTGDLMGFPLHCSDQSHVQAAP